MRDEGWNVAGFYVHLNGIHKGFQFSKQILLITNHKRIFGKSTVVQDFETVLQIGFTLLWCLHTETFLSTFPSKMIKERIKFQIFKMIKLDYIKMPNALESKLVYEVLLFVCM